MAPAADGTLKHPNSAGYRQVCLLPPLACMRVPSRSRHRHPHAVRTRRCFSAVILLILHASKRDTIRHWRPGHFVDGG